MRYADIRYCSESSIYLVSGIDISSRSYQYLSDIFAVSLSSLMQWCHQILD